MWVYNDDTPESRYLLSATEFSFVYWPFSLKLLWAPIVDSLYSQRFGRRKTWLIPVQYLMGTFMLFLSGHVEYWLGDDHEKPNIGLFTMLFLALNVLAATQDIIVDGWSLTMLRRCNVGYASTCNSVGQTAGYFIGYVFFMALESPEFCNAYLRSEPSAKGIITLPGFLHFWGWIFIITTTLVAILKSEKIKKKDEYRDLDNGVKHAYKVLWDIIKLPNIKIAILVFLTAKVGFSACDAVTGLKMIDAGIPKEKFALMAVPMIPLQIVLPLFISKYTTGLRPMDIYLKAIPYRLAFGLLAAFLVWITPSIIVKGEIPVFYFIILTIIYMTHQICLSSMFVATMAFFAKISDPAIGGTYMTFLNTLSNLGANWPATAALWFVDALTFKRCNVDATNDCSTTARQEECVSKDGGVCDIYLDGYYIESIICVIIGFLWFRWGRRKIDYLQKVQFSTWQVVGTRLKS
ncbi:acetyl-coenzyme A transporter 1 isoform X2 [Orussus abietinus]|uniref:acetyl-coenzyme A transporter 1 isoform X2 n=1 Tax=Orussus abietinus TaxID=222816 RepID=UPI000C715DAC|nr:acetyl-coenzyme A transporter 1 isoform X2 [Orussus abietinus]